MIWVGVSLHIKRFPNTQLHIQSSEPNIFCISIFCSLTSQIQRGQIWIRSYFCNDWSIFSSFSLPQKHCVGPLRCFRQPSSPKLNSPSRIQRFAFASLASIHLYLRAEKGLQPVKICKTLTISAQKYSRTMAQQNFFAHEGKDGSTPGERMQSAGYDWENSTSGSMVAENIAAGQQSVSEVMKGWKKSTSHYKNMTESKFIHVGFGMSENKKSKFKKYWVQNFGY